ncbi:hypothetical protein [Duganella radicis]|uniref:Uncharacterized protein n=1 Tax=Duganella radicis TaxID=551988 RepID=A0A6L6PB46_9BURK|nr:hypothetical protein [Duganella radicis]MTV36268.1 hypothetical protein [Duganella radicis]
MEDAAPAAENAKPEALPPPKPEPSPEEKAAAESAAMVQALMTALPVLAPAYVQMKSQELDAIKENNAKQAALWEKALTLESVFIGLVLFGGFFATAMLAYVNQVASAEKVAFALFGFIGGRGFLHIRGLINSATKRD